MSRRVGPQGFALSQLHKATVRVDLASRGNGTGFCVAPDYVLTCHHVVEAAIGKAAVDVSVVPYQGSQTGMRLLARVEQYNRNEDLALLRVEGLDLPAVPFDTDTLPQDS